MGELITFTEAAERTGVSIVTLRKRIRESRIVIYTNPRDKREKLVDADDVDAMMQPTPIRPADEGKAAA